MTRLIAVETSDLVGSTKLSAEQLKATQDLLKKVHQRQLETSKDQAEYFRGDAYQVLYAQPQYALRKVLMTKLALKYTLIPNIEVSQSLAFGEADINHQALNQRMDPVFIESGRGLDSTDKGNISINASFIDDSTALNVDFLNRLLSLLSAKQAEALYWYIALDFPEQKHIAERLSTTRQNINTHLQRANADLVRRFIMFFEKQLSAYLSRHTKKDVNQ